MVVRVAEDDVTLVNVVRVVMETLVYDMVLSVLVSVVPVVVKKLV